MPFKWKCSNCGKVFHQNNDIETLDEILSKFNGRCPLCSAKLAAFPKDVKVRPARE